MYRYFRAGGNLQTGARRREPRPKTSGLPPRLRRSQWLLREWRTAGWAATWARDCP